MRVAADCFPCFLRQVVIALGHARVEEAMQLKTLKEASQMLPSVDTSKTPAHFTTLLHRRLRQSIGRDPFKDIKSRYNSVAIGLYRELKDTVNSSTDPLNVAVRLAIAGNIIDFGIFTSIDIRGTIDRALNSPLAIDRYDDLVDAIDRAENILYLLDNTGEALFDRLLIERLTEMGKEITAVVKGENVLNDATIEDAKEVGLLEVCRVIDNGSDCIGTILDWTSEAFQREFKRYPLIISKGQGNFETLHDYRGHKTNIFFLFQAKCDALSKMLGLQKGSMLLTSSEKDFRDL
jgi:uncharacterized protein with ATP-grasp and redox domains